MTEAKIRVTVNGAVSESAVEPRLFLPTICVNHCG